MNQLPVDIANNFSLFKNKHGVATGDRQFFMKWLRYYWDFCLKYKFALFEKPSVLAFIKKLEEKNQPEMLRLQAQKAIDLFLKMQSSGNAVQVAKNQQNNNWLKDKAKSLHSKESGYAQGQIDTRVEKIVTQGQVRGK